MTETPPKGFGWTLNPFGRTLALSLAVVSLLLSGYSAWRYLGLVDCLADQAFASQQRTSAIAAATDAEREADLALLRGGLNNADLQRAAVSAREVTDRVRAAHPAPPVKPCR